MACLTVTGRSWAQLKPGVVVENVATNSEAEKAGIQQADILLGLSSSLRMPVPAEYRRSEPPRPSPRKGEL